MHLGKNKIGVVTVTYNSATVIDGFLRSILAQTHQEFLLYIIDNASKDATLSRVAAMDDPRFHTVANEANLGVAEGNNQGIRLALAAGCDFILLLNNDTEFDADLFSKMLSGIDTHRSDMLVPKIMFFDPKDVIWSAGGYFRPWAGYVVGHFGDGQRDLGQFARAQQRECAPTCCMLIRSAVFERVGLMDPTYFVYCDDTDFCWRALKLGVRLWYDPEGVLYHKVSSLTGGSESDFTIGYGNRNKVYFALKHFGFFRRTYCLAIYRLIFLIKRLRGTDSKRVYTLKVDAWSRGIDLYRGRSPGLP